MSSRSDKGIDNLHQALTDVLELDKCSICLDKLKKTVILWPCSHRFCNDCIRAYLVSVDGEKITCPLCKRPTTRRRILRFQDIQEEFVDNVQSLVKAINLDLGFDITSFKPLQQNEESDVYKTSNNTSKNKILFSPVRKNKSRPSRTIIYKNKINSVKRLNRKSTGSSLSAKTVETSSIKLDGDKPFSPKVKKWLAENSFSQGELHDITSSIVVVDVHKPDLEHSDDQFVSVSQVELKTDQKSDKIKLQHKMSPNASTDIDAIKPFDETLIDKHPTSPLAIRKSNRIGHHEKFDQLLQGKNSKVISKTYQSKNPTRKCKTRSKFHIEADLIKDVGETTNKNIMSDFDKVLDSSQNSFEDFSSGSGEEWTVERKTNKVCSNKNKTFDNFKNIKKLTKPKNNRNLHKDQTSLKIKKSDVTITKQKDIKGMLKNNIISAYDIVEDDKLNEVTKHSSVSPLKNESDKNKRSNIVKRIIDDWDISTDITNINCPLSGIKSANLSKNLQSATSAEITPVKQENHRSPGWSRLSHTKKEFHVSERKKLSLKTVSKSTSGSALIANGDSLIRINQSPESLNTFVDNFKENKGSSLVCQFNCFENNENHKVEKPDKMVINDQPSDSDINKVVLPSIVQQSNQKENSDINKSHSSDSGSPCIGFTSQEQQISSLKRQSFPNLENYCEKSIINEELVFSKAKNFQVVTSTEQTTKEDVAIDLHEFNSKHLPMEVDAGAFQCNVEKEQHCLKINEQRKLIADNKSKQDINYSNSDAKAETKNVCSNDQAKLQQIKIRKRERGPDMHDNSATNFPERKRKCKDAEVQTSPSRMQFIILDVLKEIWGAEADQKLALFENCIAKKLHFDENNGVDQKNLGENVFPIASSQGIQPTRELIKSPSDTEKCLNDSDFIFGTQNPLMDPLEMSYKEKVNELRHATISSSSGKYEDVLVIDASEIDCDAPTQPYKTPVVSKRQLKNSTSNLYSAVSDPSDSELKKVNEIFESSDVLFPDATSKKATPWNCSGIMQLECDSANLNKNQTSIDNPSPLKASKLKTNKSRRQLDFVDEDRSDSNVESLKNNSEKISIENVLSHKSSSYIDAIISTNECLKENNSVSTNQLKFFDCLAKREKSNISPVATEENKHNNINYSQLKTDNGRLSEKHGNGTRNEGLCVAAVKCNEFLTETPDIVLSTEEQALIGNLIHKRDKTPSLESSNEKKDLACLHTKKVDFIQSTPKSSQEQSFEHQNTNISVGIFKNHEKKTVDCNVHTSDENSTCDLDADHINDIHCNYSLVAVDNKVENQEHSCEEESLKHSTDVISKGSLCADEMSNASNEDFFIEGTPSQSPKNVKRKQKDEFEKHQDPSKMDSTNSSAISCEKPAACSNLKNIEECLRTESTKETENAQENNRESDVIENSQCETEKYCFSSSLLTSRQNQVLGYVLKGLDIPFSKTMDDNISHLVVSNTEGYAKNSYKFLLAMALHKPIITYNWIEDVLKVRKTLPLEPYLAVDRNGVCGVLRAKQDLKRELLQNFVILIYNTVDNEIQRHQIEHIIKLCGGIVVSHLHQFATIPRRLTKVILLSKKIQINSEAVELLKCQNEFDAQLVEIMWLYDTISQYRVLPFGEYSHVSTSFLTESCQEDITNRE